MIPGWGKIFNIPSVFSSFYICPTKHKMRKSPRQKGRPIFPQELFPLLWVSNPAWLAEQQRWTGWLSLLQDVLCYQVSEPAPSKGGTVLVLHSRDSKSNLSSTDAKLAPKKFAPNNSHEDDLFQWLSQGSRWSWYWCQFWQERHYCPYTLLIGSG